jgi:hypothetical protein
MGLFKSETSPVCQACGRPTTADDPAVTARDGARIHKSHTTNPRSGYYGERSRNPFRR